MLKRKQLEVHVVEIISTRLVHSIGCFKSGDVSIQAWLCG